MTIESGCNAPAAPKQGYSLAYEEDFREGNGGFFGFKGNFEGPYALDREDDAIVSYGPWWIDYNHAPPHGGGYLSLMFGLMTRGPLNEPIRDCSGRNRFIENQVTTDFRGARLNLRLRGELEELRGAQLALLIQSAQDGICSGWVLTGQPIKITPQWHDHELALEADDSQWASLGSRPDRTETYGEIPLADVLADVNVNIYLVLFPLEVGRKGPMHGDSELRRPGRDFRVWQNRLPDGYVALDRVQLYVPRRQETQA